MFVILLMHFLSASTPMVPPAAPAPVAVVAPAPVVVATPPVAPRVVAKPQTAKAVAPAASPAPAAAGSVPVDPNTSEPAEGPQPVGASQTIADQGCYVVVPTSAGPNGTTISESHTDSGNCATMQAVAKANGVPWFYDNDSTTTGS